MQPDGGGAAAPPQENAKRMRRPSVRLQQPYYENPGHRKLQHQWSAKKLAAPPRKPRTAKIKDKKNHALNEKRNLDLDDDVAIGNWRNFTDRDFKRKRIRSSNSRNLVLAKCQGNGVDCGEEQKEEEDLGGTDSNLVVEDSNPSSPIGKDDNGNRKSSDDINNMVLKRRDNQQSIERGVDLMKGGVDGGSSSGVRMWLNDLGLGKYVGLFKMHGVDDEVLPLLTLEDLKDMKINEVGVRRKMYSSIQKLHRSFS